MNIEFLVNLSYVVASVLFILGLKMLGSPASARKGNMISALGMFIAVVVTLLDQQVISYEYIVAGIVVGSLIGWIASRIVPMTSMPEMVAIFNGFGGAASLLVGWAEYIHVPDMLAGIKIATVLSILIGAVTFTGSIIAFMKLAGWIGSAPVVYSGQKIINGLIASVVIAAGIAFVANYMPDYSLWIVIGVSLLFGILLVIPIGGADMPVVISLLNSYSGLAATAVGFVLLNNVLIVSGALVGASGIILTGIMCKAMNRSLSNVLFSGFGSVTKKAAADAVQGEVKPISTQDSYYILESATNVVFVPGYGMAVSQAQHVVRELTEILEDNGAEVRFAIHPVAGRMPGHMNVLLAEANVSYDLLVEPEAVNPIMETVDVCIIIGANDVVNPTAKTVESSPIYGMPIIEADRAKTVFVLKRSMASGFSGVDNPLFFNDNTRMIFGDAKASLSAIISEFKS